MSNLLAQQTRQKISENTKERFITLFFVLYKTARIVDLNNDTFKNQLDSFFEFFGIIAEEAIEISLKTIKGHLFINSELVKFNTSGLSGAEEILSEWQAFGIGGIIFNSEIQKSELGLFFRFIADIKPDDHNLESLTAQLKKQGLKKISLLSIKETDSDEPQLAEDIRKEFRAQARVSFYRSMSMVEDIIVGSIANKEINSAKTKRVVHNLIDQLMLDESSLIELTAIRDYDDYTFAHSLNVAIYALTVGIKLKLDRARLSQLGFSALFHDAGKIKLPADLIRKPDAFDENDWIQMQRHPILGVKTILRSMKLNVHTARAALVAFEHHINNDLTGYPMLHTEKAATNLFSRIVSIVDSFDALVSGRIYIKKSIPTDEVLKKMRYQMSSKFDVFLLKLFNNIVGIYPAGSLVLLNTEEIALVLANNADNHSQPYIKIIGDHTGLLDSSIWVDLSQPEHSNRTITRQIDPQRYGLELRDFVLDDQK